MRVFYGHQRYINGRTFLVKTERGLSWFSRLSAVKKKKEKREMLHLRTSFGAERLRGLHHTIRKVFTSILGSELWQQVII